MRRAVGLPERDGVLVRSVADGSPASRAELERGDLIVGADDAEIDGVDALYRALDGLAPGSTLTLEVLRGADERRVTVDFSETEG
jgi:S1-C subfamily serine protease